MAIWVPPSNTQGGVNEILGSGLPVTAELGLYALSFALLIGVLAGVFAALKPNIRQDYIPMGLAMMGICMPSFLLGPIVLVFGIYLDWLPIAGWGDLPGDKILPSITLGSAYAAYIARLSRAGMLEILSQDYIRTARAKGLPEWRVVTQHALRGGLIPLSLSALPLRVCLRDLSLWKRFSKFRAWAVSMFKRRLTATTQ